MKIKINDTNIWVDAQRGEFDWHYKNPWRADDWDFIINTKTLFEYFNFERDDFKYKSILDVGAGPRLRTKYFKNAIITALEPLGERYICNFKWCDLRDVPLYVNAIEEFIPELANQFDFIISINALDHCYDFSLAVSNMCQYLKHDGLLFLSYDCCEGSDLLHPLNLNEELSEKVFKLHGLNYSNKFRHLPYSPGKYSINYWLEK
jgi:SAM-dependent methyltransferase